MKKFIFLLFVLFFQCNQSKDYNGVENNKITKLDSCFYEIDKDLYELCSSNTIKFDKYKIDSLGIYKIELNGKDVYYPVTISQAAVTFYKKYKETNDKSSLDKFLLLSSWLKNNFKDNGDYGFWMCYEDYPGYELKSPWCSAMAQGFGLMVMYESFEITKDSSYIVIAEKALNGYEIEIKNGGFTNKVSDFDYQYEEYPTREPSMILNGFIFSLSGLIDYYEATGSEKALDLFNKGVLFLNNNLDKYTLDFTSKYNLYYKKPQLASAINKDPGDGYHHLHIQQLAWLYLKTRKKIFAEIALNFLETDLGDFEFDYNFPPKIKHIMSDYCIDCENYGAGNLIDGNWTYGNYWSSNKNSELIVDLGSFKTNIDAMTLFMTDSSIKKMSMRILIPDKADTNKWILKSETPYNISDDRLSFYYYKTNNYQTFVYTIKFLPFDSRYVKIQFLKEKSLPFYGIREFDLQYDRIEDLNKVLKKMCGN